MHIITVERHASLTYLTVKTFSLCLMLLSWNRVQTHSCGVDKSASAAFVLEKYLDENLLSHFYFISANDWNRTWRVLFFFLLFWWKTTFCLVNINQKRFVVAGEPIKQLRSVKISLCVEANTWARERRGDRCSMSLPVFLLIPQDKSVSAPTPSLLSHASICPRICLWLKFWSHSPSSSSSSFCLPPLVLCSSHSPPPSLSVFFLSVSSSFLFLLFSCISPSRLLCLFFVSFSSSGGWRHASPLRLPTACCGNNSCHSVVEKLTEKNQKKGEGMLQSKNHAKHN